MKTKLLLCMGLMAGLCWSCQKDPIAEEPLPQAQVSGSLMNPSKFVSAASAGSSLAACDAIWSKYGVYGGSSADYVYQLLINDEYGYPNDYGSDPQANLLHVMRVIDDCLSAGKPVIAGIIHFTYDGWYQSEHYVVIVGRGTKISDGGREVVYYSYMDPSASNASDGCNEEYNQLEAIHYSGEGSMINIQGGYGWEGHHPGYYHVTHIRPSQDIYGGGRPYIPVIPPM